MCCAAGNFSRYGHKRCQIQWPQPEKVDQKMCYWLDFD